MVPPDKRDCPAFLAAWTARFMSSKQGAGVLAESAGDVIGAQGLRDAGIEASRKTERLETEERIVLAHRHTSFVIYMQALPEVKKK